MALRADRADRSALLLDRFFLPQSASPGAGKAREPRMTLTPNFTRAEPMRQIAPDLRR